MEIGNLKWLISWNWKFKFSAGQMFRTEWNSFEVVGWNEEIPYPYLLFWKIYFSDFRYDLSGRCKHSYFFCIILEIVKIAFKIGKKGLELISQKGKSKAYGSVSKSTTLRNITSSTIVPLWKLLSCPIWSFLNNFTNIILSRAVNTISHDSFTRCTAFKVLSTAAELYRKQGNRR